MVMNRVWGICCVDAGRGGDAGGDAAGVIVSDSGGHLYHPVLNRGVRQTEYHPGRMMTISSSVLARCENPICLNEAKQNTDTPWRLRDLLTRRLTVYTHKLPMYPFENPPIRGDVAEALSWDHFVMRGYAQVYIGICRYVWGCVFALRRWRSLLVSVRGGA